MDASFPPTEISLEDQIRRSKQRWLCLYHDKNCLKTLHSDKASNISRLTWQFNQCQFEANQALSRQCMKIYNNRSEILHEIEFERERCLQEWRRLGIMVERFTDEMNNLRKIISELEKMGDPAVI